MKHAMVLPKTTHASALPVDDWAKKIKCAWGKCVGAIFEVGHLLQQAKDELPHGQFESMVREKLPFSVRKAQRLMAISRSACLKDHQDRLPPCWATLDALTKLEQPTFEAALTSGEINPAMTRRAAEHLVRGRRLPSTATSHEGSNAVIAGSSDRAEIKPAELVQAMQSMIDISESVDLQKFSKKCPSERRDALLQRIAVLSDWLPRLRQCLEAGRERAS